MARGCGLGEREEGEGRCTEGYAMDMFEACVGELAMCGCVLSIIVIVA